MKHKTYDIHCAQCGAYVLSYHKKGAGRAILRLYFSCIAAPAALAGLHRSDFERISEVPDLRCPSCGEVLGVSALSKGHKWVFRMRQGYFHRKLKK